MQETQETQVQFLGQKMPWRRAWQPTPVFVPGESHGLGGGVGGGHSSWGLRVSDMTEVTEHTYRLTM